MCGCANMSRLRRDADGKNSHIRTFAYSYINMLYLQALNIIYA
jgi:hypothetical protein